MDGGRGELAHRLEAGRVPVSAPLCQGGGLADGVVPSVHIRSVAYGAVHVGVAAVASLLALVVSDCHLVVGEATGGAGEAAEEAGRPRRGLHLLIDVHRQGAECRDDWV